VVVIIESGIPKLLRLPRFQHAQRSASFEAKRFYASDHFRHFLDVTLLGPPPCRPHAKSRRSPGLRFGRGCQDLIQRQHFLIRHASVIARCLRTISTIFRAATGLHGNQGGQLYPVRVVVLTMNQLRAMDQITERQMEQRFNTMNIPA
jgi:hypothetical protein